MPLVFYFVFFKRNHASKILRVIPLYCIYSFVNDYLLLNIDSRQSSIPYILATFTVLEYFLFALYFYLSLRTRYFKYLILILSIPFIILAIYYFYTLQFKDSDAFDTIPAVIECSLIMGYCILYLFEQIKTPQTLFIYNTKGFWVLAGILIYLSATIFLFALADQLSDEYWDINLYANFIKNMLFAIAVTIKEAPAKDLMTKNGLIKFSIDDNKLDL